MYQQGDKLIARQKRQNIKDVNCPLPRWDRKEKHQTGDKQDSQKRFADQARDTIRIKQMPKPDIPAHNQNR